jgi:hypothetical protein
MEHVGPAQDDFVEIKRLGFNSVRLPFGYWCVDGAEAEGVEIAPFVGGGTKYIDKAVSSAQTKKASIFKTASRLEISLRFEKKLRGLKIVSMVKIASMLK